MASLVAFEKINGNWQHRRGKFEIVFGALYEVYLDKSKTPAFCADILPKIQGALHDFWPDKYERPDVQALDYLPFTEFPAGEQHELLRATENLLQDFVHDRVDPHIQWNRERGDEIIESIRELAGLMRDEIAASHPAHP